MIQHCELRHGNYIQDETGWIQVEDEYPSDLVEPIHITKELLVEKCGFTTNDRDVTSIEISDTASLVYFEGRFQIVTISKSSTSLYHIKYLHQLQNLVHSLTGNEMPIKI